MRRGAEDGMRPGGAEDGIWDMGECAESGREVEGMTNQVGERRSYLFLIFFKKAS